MKYIPEDVQVTFREIPDCICLTINISGCKVHCPGCHSKYLWEDIGEELTPEVVADLLDKNKGVNCVVFFGGNDYEALNSLAMLVKLRSDFPYKVAWYTGEDKIPDKIALGLFDYVKVGPYIEEKGPLDKETTNQKLYKVDHVGDGWNKMTDITSEFWHKQP